MESSIKSLSRISLQSRRESSIKIFVLCQTTVPNFCLASFYSPKSSSCVRLQSHLHQTTVPPASDYSPTCIRLRSHLHQTTVPPASDYSPTCIRLRSHLHQTTVPPASDYSSTCIRLQSHLHQTTVPPASDYGPTCIRLQSRRGSSTRIFVQQRRSRMNQQNQAWTRTLHIKT